MLLFTLMSCSMLAGLFGGPADLNDTTEIIVEVPRGATARSMGPILEKADAIDGSDGFVNYVRMTGEGGCIKAGRHEVSRSMSAGEILDALCGVPLTEEVPFTVLEGWRIREIDAALSKKGLIRAGEYKALAMNPSAFKANFSLPANSLEGYLFPETYMVDEKDFDPKQFIQRQLNMLDQRFVQKHPTGFGKRSLNDVVIMASMIVREEPTEKQRPLVSGILWKRIDNQWNLGVDATSRYTLPKWNDRTAFLKKLRDPKDRYNTRLRPGLPPTAIGNPDLSSLNAASEPRPSPYWYYLHDKDGVIHPSKNVREHEAYRRKYNVY
jgi:UPF0755 protein